MQNTAEPQDGDAVPADADLNDQANAVATVLFAGMSGFSMSLISASLVCLVSNYCIMRGKITGKSPATCAENFHNALKLTLGDLANREPAGNA